MFKIKYLRKRRSFHLSTQKHEKYVIKIIIFLRKLISKKLCPHNFLEKSEKHILGFSEESLGNSLDDNFVV